MNGAPETIGDRLAALRGLFSLKGRTALVLGAASGIGKASAEAMAALGATVICADRNKEGIDTVASELQADAHVVDAASSDNITALAASIKQSLPGYPAGEMREHLADLYDRLEWTLKPRN